MTYLEQSDSRLLRSTIREFSKREDGSFLSLFHKARDLGLFQTGLRISDSCVILEQLSQSNCSLAVLIFTHLACAEILSAAEDAISLDSPLAFSPFFNPTESNTEVKASRMGDYFSLTGRADSLLLTDHAQKALIAAETEHNSVSYFVVPLSGKGITLSAPVRTLGIRFCPLVDLDLEEVPGTLIGFPGDGVNQFNKMLNRTSIAAGAISLGLARGSLDEALQYAKIRRQGGREIIHWSEIKLMLANMSIRIRNAELALSKACETLESQEHNWEEFVSAVSIQLQEIAPTLTSDGIQILGGAGYTHEYDQEARFRDAYHVQNLLGSLSFRKLRHAHLWLTDAIGLSLSS